MILHTKFQAKFGCQPNQSVLCMSIYVILPASSSFPRNQMFKVQSANKWHELDSAVGIHGEKRKEPRDEKI